MLSDIEEKASLNGETAQYSHELVIRDDNESATMTPQSIATTGETSLNLAQGENWLRLVETLDLNSVLHDTQETTAGVHSPYPSIVSLAEVGMIDAPTDDCYICIDVDGPHAAMKDMRAPIASSDEVAELEVCIARRKRPTLQVDSDDDYNGQDSNVQTDRKYHPPEPLGRRQLRILHKGDVIATRSTGGEDTIGLILEYRRYKGAPRSRADDERAVEGSETAIESQNNTQHGTSFIVIQTQENGNEGGESTNDDEEDETTQAFPKPVLTTQQDPNTQDMESDDETSIEEEHEVNIQQVDRVHAPTRAFPMPAIDSEPEDDDIMEQPTQALSMAPQVVADITEQPTQALSMAAEVDADIMEQSTQALSSHAEDSEVPDNAKEAVIASDEDLQVEREASEGNNDTGGNNSVENDLAVSSAVDSNIAEEPNETAETVDDIMDEPTQALNMPVDAVGMELSTQVLMQAEIAADIMEQPTQVLNVYAEVVTDIIQEPTQAMHMPAELIADIMDQSTQALSIVDIIDQSTQVLSMHAEKSEVVDNSKEATTESDENVEVESCVEGEMDSESDVLIDDDDASGALLDNDSPQKKKADAETDEYAVAVTAEPRTRKYIDSETLWKSNINEAGRVALPMQDQRDKSDDTAQVDETLDSSSITEVDGSVRARPKNATSSVGGSNIRAPKKIVIGEISEAEPRTEADGTAQLERSTNTIEQGDKHEKSVDVASDIEVMSDSSSITEVDEDIFSNKSTSIEENASHNPQKRVDVATSESVSAHVDDSSHASSILEPPIVSPRRGLVSVSCDVRKAQETSDEPKTTVYSACKIDTAKEMAVEEEGAASQSLITRIGKSCLPKKSVRESRGGATGFTTAQQPQRETHSSLPDEEAASLPRHREVKDATVVLSLENRIDDREATDEQLVKATTAAFTSSRDSASVPDAREEGKKGAPEIETPRRTRPRKAHNTPRRQTKEDSPLISTHVKGDVMKRAREDYSLRNSTRKCSRAAVYSQSSEEGPIRVIITGFDITAHHKKMLASIGGELLENIEDASSATHVIAGDNETSLRRTPKLMIGVCRTSKIVHMDWLIQSAKARKALPCNDFLLLGDKKAEETYEFDMRNTLQRGDELRNKNRLLLSGYGVYICSGVAGVKAPPKEELKLIVDAAGGKWLSSFAPRDIGNIDASKILIVTKEKPDKKRTKSIEASNVNKAVKLGAQTCHASWLFQCIIRQSMTD